MVSPNTTKNFIDCSEFENGSSPEMFRSSGVRGAMYLFMTGVIFITVFGNLVLIISISYFKQLHSPTNFLILSMAITDFLLGFTIMPYSRGGQNFWPEGHIGWPGRKAVPPQTAWALPPPTSRAVPAAFAFGIVFSEAYASEIQGYKILVACSSLCPIVFNKLWGTVLFTVGLFAPGCVMIGIYAIFFVISKKHARVVNNMPDDANNEVRSQLSKKKDRKAATTLSIVMGMFLICWFPCFITFLIDPFLNFTTTLALFDALNWFGYFNSTCNPLIYDIFIHGKIFNPQSHTTNLFAKNQPQ
uniref:G-protein coupled receptors family 1 profile domain-containing protein n=1 Tax=Terrapene triunguis TaxID=2587831 RepID=A0A674I029_9SAUR